MRSEKYKIKTETLSNDKGDAEEIRVLNEIIRVTAGGLKLKADPRHAELVIKELGVENSKPTRTPGVKCSHKKPTGIDVDIVEDEEAQVVEREGDSSVGDCTLSGFELEDAVRRRCSTGPAMSSKCCGVRWEKVNRKLQ